LRTPESTLAEVRALALELLKRDTLEGDEVAEIIEAAAARPRAGK
jgi:hypothetical protein